MPIDRNPTLCKICPECNHDMFWQGACLECGFEGIGYCSIAWARIREIYPEYYQEIDFEKEFADSGPKVDRQQAGNNYHSR